MSQSTIEIIPLFNEVLEASFSSMSELENVLSEKFRKELDHTEDAQVAFDELDSEVNGLLGKFFCYSLTENGESWHVGIGESFDESKLATYLQAFNEYYNEPFRTLDDILSKLEYRVLKDMDNAGCDAKSALRMILEEDLLLEDVFRIDGADAEPRILYVEF